MFKSKTDLIVVLTVFDADALRLSVPPLQKLGRSFTLIVYNDNPNQVIERRTIRHFGWHGPLHIINSDKNYGEFESRINAIKSVRELNVSGNWIIFLDQDDVLLDACVPDVTENIFAIVQNATIISDNITDMFKINSSWTDGGEYGKNGPHFEITGTILRRTIVQEFADFITDILPKLYRDLRHTRYRVPIANLLWGALKSFVQIRHPEMSPIYMNRTNYVAIKLGNAPVKYGRRTPNGANANAAISETIKRFMKTFESAAKIVASNA